MKSIRLMMLAATAAFGLTAPVAAQTNLKMATIAPGTSAYLTMTTMATMVNQALDDVNIQVDATGAATQHVVEVANGNLDMSMTSPTVHNFLTNGTAMYAQLPNAPELAEKLCDGQTPPAGMSPSDWAAWTMLASAVYNATGARLRRIPLTPERVWTALQEQSK